MAVRPDLKKHGTVPNGGTVPKDPKDRAIRPKTRNSASLICAHLCNLWTMLLSEKHGTVPHGGTVPKARKGMSLFGRFGQIAPKNVSHGQKGQTTGSYGKIDGRFGISCNAKDGLRERSFHGESYVTH